MKNFIRWLAFAMMLVCMSAIFIFSSQNSEQSNNISVNLTQKIAESDLAGDKIGESYEARDRFNGILRKYAHFMMFFCLGFTSAVFAYLSFKRMSIKLIYPLGLSLVWAIVDELHQRYVPGRTGTVDDVVIDFVGALLATAVVAAVMWTVRKIKK